MVGARVPACPNLRKNDENRRDMLLSVKDLHVHFPVKKGVFARTVGWVRAVNGVSIDVAEGETLGVVGESGCGKSTLSRAILKLVKPTSGEILFDGRDILRIHGKELLAYRRDMQVVFQDPFASLNPRHTVEHIVTDGAVVHGIVDKTTCHDYAAELMKSVGLDPDILARYPHEFSGGQRQRVCIARAIALRPELLICDEAVSALDLSVRAQVLDLLKELRETLGLSMLFITHDLGVVQHVADRVIVMNGGKVVESGGVDEVLRSPKEEYTRYLLSSVLRF